MFFLFHFQVKVIKVNSLKISSYIDFGCITCVS